MGIRIKKSFKTIFRAHKCNFSTCIFFTDRVGGRTLTLDVDIGDGKTEKFDLGGQW